MGGVAVIGGALGWALSSRSTDNNVYAVSVATGRTVRRWRADGCITPPAWPCRPSTPRRGAPVWAFSAPGNSELLSTPAIAGRHVFTGCYDDGLYAIPV